jgi:hypothetical protein
MRSAAALCAGLLAALLLAQPGDGAPARRKRGAADAGTRPVLLGTDPPGRLRPPSPGDGGAAPLDAGPDEVHLQLQALQSRVYQLERERAQSQEQAQLLQQLVGEMRDLRQQLAEAENRQRAAEQERAARHAQVQSAVSGLQAVQERLRSGDYAVLDELDQASSVLSGAARRDLEYARTALQNRDIAAARAYLSAAISHAAQER